MILSSTHVAPTPGRESRTGRRVLFVSHEASRTGAPMFLLHLVRWLRRETDLEFDVLLARGGPLEADFAEVAKIYSPKAFGDDPTLVRRYALIYSNTVCNGALIDELAADGIPVVTHAHELDSGYDWLGALNMALVMRQSARFVACAEIVRQRLRDIFRIEESLVEVRYEMIDPAALDLRVRQANPAALREAYGIPDDAFVVTGCGTLDLRKGCDLFMQAAVQLLRRMKGARPLRFLWIGAHKTPELFRTLRADVRKLGLQAEIQFIGELPSPHALIALSDVYWLTSREDPFPLSMLEAASLGRPVLCFEGAGGGVEFCARGGGIAVPYVDVGALAERTEELLHDPAKRRQLGNEAAALVRAQFSVEAIAPALWLDLQTWVRGAAPLAASPDAQVPCGEIYTRWAMDVAPGEAFIAANRERNKVIAAAKKLEAGGKRAEAIKLLVASASAGVATKDPWILLESLIEIGTALSTLEPKQSAYLLGEADRVVKANAVFKSMANFVRRNAGLASAQPR